MKQKKGGRRIKICSFFPREVKGLNLIDQGFKIWGELENGVPCLGESLIYLIKNFHFRSLLAKFEF